jgi:hypothetical protein
MWPDYQIDPGARALRTCGTPRWSASDVRKFTGGRPGDHAPRHDLPGEPDVQIVGVIPERAGNPMVFWFNRKYLEEAMEGRGGFGTSA